MESILEAIKKHSQSQPNKICLIEYGKSGITYVRFWEIINSVANLLKVKGLNRNDRVIIHSVRLSDFVIALFGVQLAGGVFVPAKIDATDIQVIDLLKITDAKYLITNDLSESIRRSDLGFETIDEKEIHKFVEASHFDKNASFDLPENEDLAEITFTTGTTGDAKGIMISHGNNIALAENIVCGVEMKPNNVELIPVPINHSYGLRSFYASMYNGSTVVLVDGFANIREFFLSIEKYCVTSMALVPAIISMIINVSEDYLVKYRSQIDYIQSGSAALSEKLKQKLCELLPESRLYNFYGSTEAGRCCIINYNENKGMIQCIGKPAINSKIIIIDDSGKEMLHSKDNVGRLACSGTMIMLGYWKNKKATDEIKINDYIVTNDLCYIENEYVYYLGRLGDIINVGGNKVSPYEIEEVVLGFEKVKECVCIPVADEVLGQVPKLFVVPRDHSIKKGELVNFLKSRVETFKIPKYIEIITSVPKLFNGKIDRSALSIQ